MKVSNYKVAKSMLRAHAEYISVQFRSDKPAIRQGINDYTHEVCKEFNLSNYHQNLLHNYACTLHPKD